MHVEKYGNHELVMDIFHFYYFNIDISLTIYIIQILDSGPRGLPLITYAPRGGGGVNTNAYKCVQGGRGGLKMPKNTHFVRRLIKNATISETF